MSILLKNALIIDSKSPANNQRCNLLIEDGIIKSLKGKTAKKILDLNGKCVTPGWFDLNANFNDPGFEHKEDILSGSKTAVVGGFTDVNLIPATNPPFERKGDVEFVLNRADSSVNLHVCGGLSEGLKGENLNELLDLHAAGATSFGDGDFPIWNAELLLKSLQYTDSLGSPIIQNARDKHLSLNTHMHEGVESTLLGLRGEPSISEELIVQRDLDILKYAGGRIHFTKLSSSKSLELIKKAKKAGLNVTADVAIHHLVFTDKTVQGFDSNYKSLPPFRTEKDRRALIKGVKEGVIDAICSNHRPQDQESKQLEFDLAESGSLSLQTFFPELISISKEVPLEILVDRVTNGPRRILGFDEISIEEGMPAKLTICDPDQNWSLNRSTNTSKSNNSPFWEEKLTGKVIGTINNRSINLFD